MEEEDSDEEDDDDEDSEADLSEIRIVPEDKNMCRFDLQLLSGCTNAWNCDCKKICSTDVLCLCFVTLSDEFLCLLSLL